MDLLGAELIDSLALECVGAEGAGGEDVDAVLLVASAPVTLYRASTGLVHPVQKGGAETLERLRW